MKKRSELLKNIISDLKEINRLASAEDSFEAGFILGKLHCFLEYELDQCTELDKKTSS